MKSKTCATQSVLRYSTTNLYNGTIQDLYLYKSESGNLHSPYATEISERKSPDPLFTLLQTVWGIVKS